ncbi:hypothetical protein JOD02_000050 [Caldicoprobacter guelmensis]|nr:hypothetical protein [Caldicoprobacter guelmensis]
MIQAGREYVRPALQVILWETGSHLSVGGVSSPVG